MGNKPSSHTNEKWTQYILSTGKDLQPSPSEESYLPMPLTMRKTLIGGRKFRPVSPPKKTDFEMTTNRDGLNQIEEELDEKPTEVEPKRSVMLDRGPMIIDYDDVEDLPRDEEEEHDKLESSEVTGPHQIHFEPIVTVLSFHDKSQSNLLNALRVDKSPPENAIEKPENTKSFPRSPNMMNRRYSLIDTRTGLKKSKFTLELEEKLKKSKLELGFDDDLNDWKEFSYSVGKPESKVEPLRRGSLNFDLGERVGVGLDNVRLKEPLQYCAQNCNILGLCSIRHPDILPKTNTIEPSAFKDEVKRRLELNGVLNKDHKKHPQKDCNCQHCMLAYLTEMGYPGEKEADKMCVVSKKKGKSPTESPASCRRRAGAPKEERIRIVENENRRRSIEICFKEDQSSARSGGYLSSSQTSISTVTIDGDFTNKAIKRMFRENKSPRKDIHSSPNQVRQVLSLTNHTSGEQIHDIGHDQSDGPEETVQVQRAECRRRPLPRGRFTGGGRLSSSSVTNTSKTSSLSSIMSYKRVRQIFQTIIERNRPRRRARKNIHKFQEMQELGLGEVKNNRWYPSEHKALSIWNGIHQNVQGVQAEFKKYPKTSTKCTVD